MQLKIFDQGVLVLLGLSHLPSGSTLPWLSLTLVSIVIEVYQGVLLLHLHLALVELLLHRVLVAAATPLPVLLSLHLALLPFSLGQERRIVVLSGWLVRPSTCS